MEGFDVSCRALADTDESGGGGIRTHGWLAPSTVFKTVATHDLSPNPTNDLEHIDERLALPLPYGRPRDPDLTLIVERWESLPGALRAGIMAMVKSASGNGGGG